MNNPPNQPQYPQPQQPMPPGYAPYPQYPPPKQGMSAGKIILIIALVCVGLFLLMGLLVGVLAVATIPKLTEAKQKLEVKQVEDVMSGFHVLVLDPRLAQLTRDAPNLSGRAFYEYAFQQGLMDSAIAPKLLSLASDAKPADAATVRMQGLPPASCSYTGPRVNELSSVMRLSGTDRSVVITFNSRNWNNYPDQGVVVVWSDSVKGEWLTFTQASSQYGITQAEWSDPAGKLFGRKAPFQHTYE